MRGAGSIVENEVRAAIINRAARVSIGYWHLNHHCVFFCYTPRAETFDLVVFIELVRFLNTNSALVVRL